MYMARTDDDPSLSFSLPFPPSLPLHREAGAAALSSALPALPHLRHLDLNRNDLGPSG